MAEGSGGGAATFSFDDLTKAASRATQLIRAWLSPMGTKSTWLGPLSVLSDAVAGSVLFCESSEDGAFIAIVPPRVPSSPPVRRLRGVVSIRVSRDGSLSAARYYNLIASFHAHGISVAPRSQLVFSPSKLISSSEYEPKQSEGAFPEYVGSKHGSSEVENVL
ncbi:hypothetical protein AB1Y20_011664 [Prymnesium parvum]|uniref:Uncharacterized protein n=1 Tax=Prymnesium parvum TaxID=97485 RepID=A0AB34IJS1_PRYPA